MISYSQVFPHLLHFSVNHHEGIIVSSYFLSEKILRPDCQDIIEIQSPGFLPPTLHFYFWLKTLTVCVCVSASGVCVCVCTVSELVSQISNHTKELTCNT